MAGRLVGVSTPIPGAASLLWGAQRRKHWPHSAQNLLRVGLGVPSACPGKGPCTCPEPNPCRPVGRNEGRNPGDVPFGKRVAVVAESQPASPGLDSETLLPPVSETVKPNGALPGPRAHRP